MLFRSIYPIMMHLTFRLLPLPAVPLFPAEKNYFYLQEFLLDNNYDIRVTVIGNRAFSFRRFNRPGDFRASGSGDIDFWKEEVDKRCLKIAFDISKTLNFQSMAYDFVYNQDRVPKIIEISYAYASWAINKCTGFWDTDLHWHKGNFWPGNCIIEDLLHEYTISKMK